MLRIAIAEDEERHLNLYFFCISQLEYPQKTNFQLILKINSGNFPCS
jgi:hypothetical protein